MRHNTWRQNEQEKERERENEPNNANQNVQHHILCKICNSRSYNTYYVLDEEEEREKKIKIRA